MNEPCLVFISVGNIAKVIADIKELMEHSGNKDIAYLLKHKMIRLERR